MKGNNTLVINKAEMIRALEYYLNDIQFKESIKISEIRENDNTFEVHLQEVEEDD